MPLSFHILDVVARDELILHENETMKEVAYEDADDGENDYEFRTESGFNSGNWKGKSQYNQNQNKSLLIHLFGSTVDGSAIRVDITGFKPFFYIQLPECASSGPTLKYVLAVKTYIKNCLQMELPHDAFGCKVVKRKVLIGFTGHKEYPFIEIKVNSIFLFRQIKDLFLNGSSKPCLAQKECMICPSKLNSMCKRCNRCGYKFCFKHKYNEDASGHDCKGFKLFKKEEILKKHVMLGSPFPANFVPKVYEANLDPFLRFLHLRNLRPCGWATVPSVDIEDSDICDSGYREYTCDWEEIEQCGSPPAVTAPFKVASWDIECFSNSGDFPVAKSGDPVIQIGTILSALGSNVVEKHIFVFGSCDKTGLEDTILHVYKTERAMLFGWLKWVNEQSIDVLIGYNIFGFDEKYVWERCEMLGLCEDDAIQNLNRLASVGGQMRLDTKRLTSAAMGDNYLYLWNTQGRLRIDLFHVIKRGYALGSYKLDDTSRNFLSETIVSIEEKDMTWILHIKPSKQSIEKGRSIVLLNDAGDSISDKMDVLDLTDGKITIQKPFEIVKDEVVKWAIVKDDVTPQEMFKLHKGSSADRAVIAKYCVQDCQLVLDLFCKLDVFNNSMSMANVCSVPVAYIFLRGQGIKIESLIFKYCYENGQTIEVMPQPSYGSMIGSDGDNDSYEGAIVLDPVPGFYTVPVGVADFASLYPSTIISENISHDTLVWVKEYSKEGVYLGRVFPKNDADVIDTLEGERYTDIEFDLLKPDPNDTRKNPQKICVGKRVCRYAQNKIGTIPLIVSGLLKARAAKRAEAKKEKDPFKNALLDSEQLAYKLTANSLYGQLGSGCFKVRQQALAASVTAYGRKQILFAKSIIETYYGPDAGDPRCSAKIVYGDTDSLFVAFHPKDPESGKLLEGKESVQATIDLTEEAGKLVTQVLKPPHDFEFDKVYWPFLIFSKKRYVGHKYEHGPDSYVLTSMGIALKRRDYAAIVKKIYGGAINILLLEKNVPKAADFVRQMAMELVEGKFGLGPLTISKSLKSEYANPNSIAHKVLADRITKRDPGNAPASGDRIQYIYVQAPTGQKAAKLQGDCIETPVYIREHGLKPDYMYYIEHQISNPVCQMFGLLLDQLPEGKSYINSLSTDPIKASVQRENIAYDLLFNKVSQVNSNGLKRAFLQMFGSGNGSSSSGSLTNPIVQQSRPMSQMQPVYTENKPKPKQSTLDSMFFDTMKVNVFKESTKKKSSKKESVVGSIESLMV